MVDEGFFKRKELIVKYYDEEKDIEKLEILKQRHSNAKKVYSILALDEEKDFVFLKKLTDKELELLKVNINNIADVRQHYSSFSGSAIAIVIALGSFLLNIAEGKEDFIFIWFGIGAGLLTIILMLTSEEYDRAKETLLIINRFEIKKNI